MKLPHSRLFYLSFFIVFTYGLILQLYAIWPFTVDDMYITLRYALQWSAHGKILWNVGEVPVEGYSNFSFLLIARLCQALHLDGVFVLKMLGAFSLGVLSVGIFLLMSMFGFGSYALIPVVWLLAYRGQIIWAASGLETTFYQSTLLFSVYFLIKTLRSERLGFASAAAGMLVLLSVTRPEGAVLSCIFMLMFGVFLWPSTAFRHLFSCLIGVWGFIFIPYFLWRWSYFGYFFPNPVYCKGRDAAFLGVLDRHYLALAWPFLCCTLPLLKDARFKISYAFLIMPSVFYFIALSAADTVVAFDNRLFLPAFALLLPLAAMGLVHLLRQSKGVYALSLFLLIACIPKLSLSDYQAFTKNPLAGEALRGQLSTWLSMHSQHGETVVLADSGLIPYRHPELRFVDSYCLNNRSMAHTPLKTRYLTFCDEILNSSPEYVILTAWIHDGQIEYAPSDACLKKKLEHTNGYQLTQVLRHTDAAHTTYQYLLFTRTSP